MSFTDEDLKRLRLRSQEYRCPCGNILCPAPTDFQALLSRLEAAEKCLVADPMPYDDRFQAWRKAKGEGE